jgi:predicted amidophosphoribosyltransferase
MEKVDCIVPVPLSPARLRSRGYNQALEIARGIAAATRARLAPELCQRSRDTAAQMDLPLAERARNVRGAFHCPGVVPGTVAVVDDVMTSGGTLQEVAATLKRAGAARVVNWVVARTPPLQFPS